MYNGYNSLRDNIQKEIENQKSVLNKFPEQISRPIAQSCSKYLAQFTSYQLPFKSDKTDNSSLSVSTSLSTTPANSSNTSTNIVSNAASNASSSSILSASTSGQAPASSNNSQQSIQQQQQQLNSSANNTNLSSSTLSPNTGILSNNSSSGSNLAESSQEKLSIIQLETAEQVNWTLENLMYGLTLSLEYQDIIKDCWNVYHDWLSVLLDEPKQFVPQPIRDDPINYSKKMLWHLYHLFIQRKEAAQHSAAKTTNSSSNSTNELTKHIMMCHGVLILIESIAKDSKLMQRDLWEEFLKFFLAINDAVLSPPFNKEDFSEVLSSRIVATLFEIWLIACNKVFPSPSLWKSFQELCSSWRHHVALVTEWNRVCFALTNRLLELIWWPESMSYCKSVITSDTNVAYDIQTIINSMNTETVIQAWFRFIHIVGRPIDFCDVMNVSKSLEIARFTRAAAFKDAFDNFASVTNFSCIKKLPVIFLECIKGISRIVDSFLGANLVTLQSAVFSSPSNQLSAKLIPLDQKARSRSIMVSSGSSAPMNQSVIGSASSTVSASSSPASSTAADYCRSPINYKSNRPSVNSLFHLVGNWLFDAAIKYLPDKIATGDLSQAEIFAKINLHNQQNRDFVLGQAEAYGILCKIVCSAKTNEQILPEYLSRFYTLLLIGLKVPANFGELNSNNEYDGGEILASIIVNGYSMFKLDLEGINILHVPMLNALNAVFKLKYPMKEDSKAENKPKELIKSLFNIGASQVTLVELKRFCIYIFSSLLCIANHFTTLPIYDKDLNPVNGQSFFSLRFKILEIFLAAMTNEQDTINLQILFGCGRLIVGEWSLDELSKPLLTPPDESQKQDKKERASYCFNQVVSLICAPLKINHATLQNHSFALSIFDSLTSIVDDDVSHDDENVFRIAISWIWHYVRTQIKRRSREHTKEMHSVIVAAYNCLIQLLIKKPNLLRDKSCLQNVTNCIEIGISGSSSYPEQKLRDEGKEGKESSGALMKSEKELKPASMRVKEAAECVLCFLMEHTSLSLADTHHLTRTPLTEKLLLELTNKQTIGKFKYFSVDGALIMGVCDKQLFNPGAGHSYPSLVVVLRGPFTCQAWSLNLRNAAFSKGLEVNKDAKFTLDKEKLSKLGLFQKRSLKFEHLSRSDELSITQRGNLPKCELSIPTMSEVAGKYVKSLSKFRRLKEEQIEFESSAVDRVPTDSLKIYQQHIENCLHVKSTQEFQSARMLLSHLGLGSLEASTEIVSLDSADSAFIEHLNSLDNSSTRTFSSCSIFYVRKNQSSARQILSNVFNTDAPQLESNFYLFLESLGSIIDVTNNFTPNAAETRQKTACLKNINKINGAENVLFWWDISSEIVFYLPSSRFSNETFSLDETFKVKNQSLPSDLKVMIVWLEQAQDADTLPVDDLILESNLLYDATQQQQQQQQQIPQQQKQKEIVIIYIQPLKSKLHRIITWCNLNKKYFYTMPLVDGMIVSSRMLSSMVRQTVLNIFRRKRLEIDDYQPPHVRRKNKIAEIIKKFQLKKSEPDFYTSLLME